jgi:hypothetical protein
VAVSKSVQLQRAVAVAWSVLAVAAATVTTLKSATAVVENGSGIGSGCGSGLRQYCSTVSRAVAGQGLLALNSKPVIPPGHLVGDHMRKLVA